MATVLSKTRMGADNREDMVSIRLGTNRPRVPYQIALDIAQSLRVGCKQAARFDHAPPSFWLDVDSGDERAARPKAHRGFRRSLQAPNVRQWEVRCNPPLVGLKFDGLLDEFGYEDGIRLSNMILAAGRRAKAWAGDTDSRTRMVGMLTDAAEDDRLGL